ncbi:MAG: zinc transporter ZupT [Thermodesulfobacteriota bacterium]
MWIPLLLATGAGLSTSIGSFMGIMVRKPGPRFMSFTLGFSAGVMVLISFMELLAGAVRTEGVGFLRAHVAFFTGMAVYFLIDLLVPHEYLGQHDHPEERYDLADGKTPQALERTGVLVALGLSIHNFPEGMATFIGGMEDIHLGLAIAVAIAIHNIPEGLAISAPIYAATGSKRKAFLWSVFSGVSEMIGACFAAIALMPFLSETVLGFVLATVGGIMVAISIDELVPAANAFGSEHMPIVGVMAGMAVMVISLWVLR